MNTSSFHNAWRGLAAAQQQPFAAWQRQQAAFNAILFRIGREDIICRVDNAANFLHRPYRCVSERRVGRYARAGRITTQRCSVLGAFRWRHVFREGGSAANWRTMHFLAPAYSSPSTFPASSILLISILNGALHLDDRPVHPAAPCCSLQSNGTSRFAFAYSSCFAADTACPSVPDLLFSSRFSARMLLSAVAQCTAHYLFTFP